MNLVLTIAIGEGYKKLSSITTPIIKSYAQKTGSEFKCITEQTIATTYPYWEKFIIGDLLESYDRILYFDSDIIIRKDCPNLFDLVPQKEIGMYNEGLLTTDKEKMEHISVMQKVFKEYKQTPLPFDGRFYNTGVIVVPKRAKSLFKKPEHESFANYWDQSYINMMLLVSGKISEVFDIGYKFNRMYYVDNKVKEHRQKSYIIHYAGMLNNLPYIMQDLDAWK